MLSSFKWKSQLNQYYTKTLMYLINFVMCHWESKIQICETGCSYRQADQDQTEYVCMLGIYPSGTSFSMEPVPGTSALNSDGGDHHVCEIKLLTINSSKQTCRQYILKKSFVLIIMLWHCPNIYNGRRTSQVRHSHGHDYGQTEGIHVGHLVSVEIYQV